MQSRRMFAVYKFLVKHTFEREHLLEVNNQIGRVNE